MPGLIEKFVNKLIVEQLAKWVRIEKGVEISILKGYVKIENVELLPSAFEALNVPVIIKRGFVRKIHVKFSLQSFLHSPIIVNVEELLCVLAPDDQWDQQKEAKRQAAVQQAKLNADDVVRKFVRDSFVYGKTAAPVELPKIVERIVDNLQVNLSFIHVAYEDHFTTPEHPFVAGVMLPQLVLRPGDKRDKNTLYKNLHIERLAVYWNADRHFHSVEALGPEEVLHYLSHAVHTCGLQQGPGEEPPTRYIVAPLTCDVEFAKRGRLAAKLTRELIASGEPIATIKFTAHEVHLDVDPSQIDALKRFMDFVTQTEKFFKRRERRPRHFLRMRGDAGASIRGWWRYAILTILDAIRHRNRKWNWLNLLQQRADRDRYVETRMRLYRDGDFFESVYQECQPICREIEDRNSYQQIIFFRNIADLEVIRSFKENPLDPALEKQRIKEMASSMDGGGSEAGTPKRGRSLWRKVKDAFRSKKSRSRARRRSNGGGGTLFSSDSEAPTSPIRTAASNGADGHGAGNRRPSVLAELGFGAGGRASMGGAPRTSTPMDSNAAAAAAASAAFAQQMQAKEAAAQAAAEEQAGFGSGLISTVEDLQARLFQRAKTLRKYASKTSESRGKSMKRLKEADVDARQAGVATAKQMFNMAEDIMQRVQTHLAQSSRTMSPQQLRQFLQDTVYPDYAAAMEEFYSFNLNDPLDAAGGSSYSKVRLDIHLGSVNLMLFEKPRQKLLTKKRASSLARTGSTQFRGWARLKRLIPALLERFPDREARNRMCKIEMGGVNMQVRMKLAGVTEVTITLDDITVRDLVFGHYWGVLVETRRDVESAPPYIRLDVVANQTLAEIDIKAHHIKGVYSRFVAVLIALMQPSTPGARGDIRFHDGMRAALNQTVRQTAAETLAQMLAKVNVILRLEATHVHGFIPEESYLSVPPHERHTLLPGGWAKSDALLMIGDVDKFACEVHLVPKDIGRDGQRHPPLDPTQASILTRIKRGAVKESSQDLIYNCVVITFSGVDGYLCRASEWRGDQTRAERRFQLSERFDFKVEIYQPLHWKTQSLRVTFPQRVKLRISCQQFKAMLALIKSIQIGQKTARVFGFNSWMHVFNIMRDFKGDAGMYQAINVDLMGGAEVCLYDENEDLLGMFVKHARVDIVSYQRTQQICLPVASARVYCWSRVRNAWETLLEHFDGVVGVQIDVKSAGEESSDRKYPSTRVTVAPRELARLPLRGEHLDPYGEERGNPFIHPPNYVPPFATIEAAEFGGGKAARAAWEKKMSVRAKRAAFTDADLQALSFAVRQDRRRSSAATARDAAAAAAAAAASAHAVARAAAPNLLASLKTVEIDAEEVRVVSDGEEALAFGRADSKPEGGSRHGSEALTLGRAGSDGRASQGAERRPSDARPSSVLEGPPEEDLANSTALADGRILVNLNAPMALVLADLAHDWQASSKEWEILPTPFQVPPTYVFRNETREPIQARLPPGWGASRNALEEAPWSTLLPGSSMALPFGAVRYRRFDPKVVGADGREGPLAAVFVQLPNAAGPRAIPAHREGTFVSPLAEAGTDVVGVVTRGKPDSIRHVTVTVAVRSCVSLRNDTEYPIEVEVASEGNAAGKAPPAVVQPGAFLSLPLAATARGSGAALLVRPAGGTGSWTATRVPLEGLRQPAAAGVPISFEAHGGVAPYPSSSLRTVTPSVRLASANSSGRYNLENTLATGFQRAMAAIGIADDPDAPPVSPLSPSSPRTLVSQPSNEAHKGVNPSLCSPALGLVLCPQAPAPHFTLPGRPPVHGPPLVIALAPPVTLRNLLPMDIDLALAGRDASKLGPTVHIAAGSSTPLSAQGTVAAIVRASGSAHWSDPLWISGPEAGRQESLAVPSGPAAAGQAPPRALASVLVRREPGASREHCREVVLCVPYYFVNDTGHNLQVAPAEAVESSKGRPNERDVVTVRAAAAPEDGAPGPAPGAVHCGERVRIAFVDEKGVGHWSEPLSLSKKVKAGTLLLHTPLGTFQFGVTIEEGPGPLLKTLTKVVTLVPRFVLVNQLKCPLEIALAARSEITHHVDPHGDDLLPELVPGAIYPLYETLPGQELLLRVGGYEWSGTFPFDPTGEDKPHPTAPTPPPRRDAADLRHEVLRSGCHLVAMRKAKGDGRTLSIANRGRRASLITDLDITRRIVAGKPPKQVSMSSSITMPTSPTSPTTFGGPEGLRTLSRGRRASVQVSPTLARASLGAEAIERQTSLAQSTMAYFAGGTDNPVRVIRANVQVKKATVFITFVEEVEHQCTLQLENKTAEVQLGERPRNGLALYYRQAPPDGAGDEEEVSPENGWDLLDANKVLPFGWERPAECPRRVQIALRSATGPASGAMTLDWKDTHERVPVPPARNQKTILGTRSAGAGAAMQLSLKFDAKGTKILRVFRERPADKEACEEEDDCGFFSRRMRLEVFVDVDAAALTVSDHGAAGGGHPGPRELLVAVVDGFHLSNDKWEKRQETKVRVARLELQNAAGGGIAASCPVLLGPVVRRFESWRPFATAEILQYSTASRHYPPPNNAVYRIIGDRGEIKALRYQDSLMDVGAKTRIVADMQPFELCVDEGTIASLVTIGKRGLAEAKSGLLRSRLLPPAPENDIPAWSSKLRTSTVFTGAVSKAKLKRSFFGEVTLPRIEAELSVVLEPAVGPEGGTAPAAAPSLIASLASSSSRGEAGGRETALSNPASALVRALALVLGTVNKAPLSVSSATIEPTLGLSAAFNERVLAKYKWQIAPQVAAVAGSLGALGQPLPVARQMASGIYDFVAEPAAGFAALCSPEPGPGVGEGIARGVTSLVTNTACLPFDWIARVTGAVGRGADLLSMDDAYAAVRRREAAQRPDDVIHGLMLGSRSVACGLARALYGLVEVPVREGQRNGVAGFGAGLAVGCIGLGTKPVAGILDGISKISSGLYATGESVMARTHGLRGAAGGARPRLPRAYGPGGSLVSFSRPHAALRAALAGAFPASAPPPPAAAPTEDGRPWLAPSARAPEGAAAGADRSGGAAEVTVLQAAWVAGGEEALVVTERRLLSVVCHSKHLDDNWAVRYGLVQQSRVAWQVPLAQLVGWRADGAFLRVRFLRAEGSSTSRRLFGLGGSDPSSVREAAVDCGSASEAAEASAALDAVLRQETLWTLATA